MCVFVFFPIIRVPSTTAKRRMCGAVVWFSMRCWRYVLSHSFIQQLSRPIHTSIHTHHCTSSTLPLGHPHFHLTYAHRVNCHSMTTTFVDCLTKSKPACLWCRRYALLVFLWRCSVVCVGGDGQCLFLDLFCVPWSLMWSSCLFVCLSFPHWFCACLYAWCFVRACLRDQCFWCIFYYLFLLCLHSFFCSICIRTFAISSPACLPLIPSMFLP